MIKPQQKKLTKRIGKLPDSTGVYFFIGKNKQILYVGKATSLKNRVRSYFSKNIGEKRSPQKEKMVKEIKEIKFEKTESVLEALLLESRLIKKIKPPYNTADKDQKSFYYIITTKEDFPRVLLVREREIKIGKLKFEINKYFGPYPHGKETREALKIIRKIFPFREKCTPLKESLKKFGRGKQSPKACFDYQIGLCPGVCIGKIDKKEYQKNIRDIETFLDGNKKKLIKNLESEMKIFSFKKEFEKANEIKNKIFALKHIHDVALIKSDKEIFEDNRKIRIEAYDIAHISGKYMVGVMTVLEDGEIKKSDYRMFKIRNQNGADDTKALREILERRFGHPEWGEPDLLVVDGGMAQLNTAKKFLNEKNINTQLVSVKKDDKHRAKEILGIEKLKDLKIEPIKKQILLANSEAHRFSIKFHRRLRDVIKS